MTRFLIIFVIGLLVSRECSSRSLPDEEESVVSVYTTQANSSGGSIDVYHQIANNIAERITSPIYRFLGIGKNTTQATTKRPWDKIELLEDGAEEATKSAINPVSNDIANEKDVEELSPEAKKKKDRKPEKITLFSSYLPAKIEANSTADDDVETFGLDDVDDGEADPKPKEGPFVFVMELIGSFVQLVYGGIVSLFSSAKAS